jgi:HD-GYP domain-containing protein (c-di-GMP phosphodiesterase class II)
MPVVPVSADSIRINQPVPFALRDASGMVLVARGGVVASEEARQQLEERGLYIDMADADAFKKAVAGKMDSMVRGNSKLGQIAKAEEAVDAAEVAQNMATQARALRTDPDLTWDGLAVKMATALREPSKEDFLDRMNRLEADLLHLLSGDVDAALLTLIYSASTELQKYSVRHALLVSVITELAARQFDAWPDEWRSPLRRAAMTMNISMTSLQDQLAMQDSGTSAHQREQISSHAQRGVNQLRDLGVVDELWLAAVEHHHSSPPGPLASMDAAMQIARLIKRADIFAARLSPRKTRAAMTATAAARSAYLDENQQTGAHQKFVSHRIQKSAKSRSLIQFASKKTVQPVGQRKHHEHACRNQVAHFHADRPAENPNQKRYGQNSGPSHDGGNIEKHVLFVNNH